MADGIVVKILGDDSDLKNKLSESSAAVAKWAAAAAAASVVAAAEITRRTAESAREIDNLSRMVGLSSAEFQRNAAAASTAGIEQQKYADIMKDVQDKVGDFLANGAGPMQDFFKNIAPQVGVTAEQFRNLSGPDALQLYVDSLQKANVNQNEMTFYMEAIASDAALLTPLLSDNGAAMQQLGDQAARAGAVLSDIEVEQMLQLNLALEKAGFFAKGLGNEIATELAPIMVGLADEIASVTGESGVMGETVTRVVNSSITGAGFVANSWRGVEVAIEGLNVAYEATKAAALSVAAAIASGFDLTVNAGKIATNGLIDIANNLPGIDLGTLTIGESDFVGNIRQMAADANSALDESLNKMHEKLMEPLPSQQLDDWVSVSREKSLERAAVMADAKAIEREQALIDADQQFAFDAEQYQLRLDALQAYEDAKLGAVRIYKAEEIKTEKDAMQAKLNLAKAEAKARRQITGDMLSNLSSLMDTENRKLFQIGKVAALANATINGYEAVVSSYARGAEIGGPVLGAAYAATAGIATAVQIGNIASTSYGSGGGGVSAAAGSSTPVADATQVGASQQQQERVFRFEGLDAGSLYSGEQLVRLADSLVELQNDGYRLVPS